MPSIHVIGHFLCKNTKFWEKSRFPTHYTQNYRYAATAIHRVSHIKKNWNTLFNFLTKELDIQVFWFHCLTCLKLLLQIACLSRIYKLNTINEILRKIHFCPDGNRTRQPLTYWECCDLSPIYCVKNVIVRLLQGVYGLLPTPVTLRWLSIPIPNRLCI